MIVAADPARMARLWPAPGSPDAPGPADVRAFGTAADGRWLVDLRKANQFGFDPPKRWQALGWRPAPDAHLREPSYLPPPWLIADPAFDDSQPADLISRVPGETPGADAPGSPRRMTRMLARVAARVGPGFSWLVLGDRSLWLRGEGLVPRSLVLALDGTGGRVARRAGPSSYVGLGFRPVFALPDPSKPKATQVWWPDPDQPGHGRPELLPAGDWRPFEAAKPFAPAVTVAVLAEPPRGAIAPKLGPAARAPEAGLWVVPGPPDRAIAGLFGSLPENVLAQLGLLTLECDGARVCVIRPARGLVEAAELPGAAMRPVPGLALWLPARSELRPAMRRDWLRDVLARDAALAWVEPGPAGVVPHRAASAGFRPALEWAEWTAPEPASAAPIDPDTSAFAMLRFDSEEEPSRKAEKRHRDRDDIEVKPSQIPDIQVLVGQRPPRPAEREFVPDWVMPAKPAAMRVELDRLATEFLALGGPLDDPRKLAYWPRMARLHDGLSEPFEALLCRCYAVWLAGPHEADVLAGWPAPKKPLEPFQEGPRRPTGAEQAEGVRRAIVMAPGSDEAGPARVWLTQHEHHLPVPAAWLAWRGLAADDALMLARARDRLLGRLFHEGVRRDRDLPGVLMRGSSLGPDRATADADSFRMLVRNAGGFTSAYDVGEAPRDLTLAYALIRSGYGEEGRSLFHSVKLPKPKPGRLEPGEWLGHAYAFRVEELLAGKGRASPWPEDLMRAYNALDINSRVAVDRYRKYSRVLEPFERIDPYRHQRYERNSPAVVELENLVGEAGTEAARAAFARIFAREHLSQQTLMQVLTAGMPMGFHVGEDFSLDLITRLLDLLPRIRFFDLPELLDIVATLETGAALAGQYQKFDPMGKLLDWLENFLKREPPERCAWMTGALSRDGRWLARMGHAERAARLRADSEKAVLGGGSLAKLLESPRTNRPVVLPALLRFVAEWRVAGRDGEADRVMAEAMTLIRDADAHAPNRFKLACAYLRTVGEASPGSVPGVMPPLTSAGLTPPPDGFGLQLVEAGLLAMGGDEVASDSKLRQVSEDVEFLLRRKIHADYAARA